MQETRKHKGILPVNIPALFFNIKDMDSPKAYNRFEIDRFIKEISQRISAACPKANILKMVDWGKDEKDFPTIQVVFPDELYGKYKKAFKAEFKKYQSNLTNTVWRMIRGYDENYHNGYLVIVRIERE